jgi:signal transduction histidine kinase
MRLSLQIKLIAFAFCIALLVGGSIAFHSMYAGKEQILRSFEREARETADLISRTVADDLYFLNVAAVRSRLESSRVNSVLRYTIVTDADGIVLTDGTKENSLRGRKLRDSLASKMMDSNRWESQADGDVLKVAGPVFMPDGNRIGFLFTGFSLAKADQAVRSSTRASLQITLICLGVGAILAVFFSLGPTRSILSIVRAAKEIGEGKLDTYLEIRRRDELGTLVASINRMAQALKRSYREMEVKVAERTRDLAALYGALSPLASSQGDQLLQHIVERLKDATHADAAMIRIFEKTTQSYLSPAHIGFPSGYLEATRRVEPDSAIGMAFRTGEPIIATNIEKDPRLKGKRQLQAGFASCAFLPLKVAGELRGVVHLASKASGYFNEEKTKHLMAIAHQMGIAMENRELFEECRRSAQEQAALSAIAIAASQSLELNEMLHNALAKTLEVTRRTVGIVRLKDNVTGRLRVVGHRGISQAYAEALDAEQRIGRKALEVLSTGKINVMDAPAPEELMADSRDEGIRSRLWVPIQAHGQILGVLTVASKVTQPFDPSEIELLKAIGSIFGTAVANARLYHQVSQKMEELQQKTADLERANRAKDEFLGVMSHELRTPLNTVIGYSAMLKEGILGHLNSRQRDAIEKILARANDQLKMINSILQATQLGAGTARISKGNVNLSDLFDDVKSAYGFPLNKSVTLHWEKSPVLPSVKSDAEKLKQILQNLIDNAVKFTPRGRINVSIRYLPDPGTVEFKVEDSGVGIPSSALPLIFDMFRQVDSSENRPFEGVGLGLYIVKTLVGLLDGSVAVQSEEGRGSTFIVAFPAEILSEQSPRPLGGTLCEKNLGANFGN